MWRAPHAREKLRAFDWGSLTSGRPSQALWLLLVPYVFANVAGWSAVPLIGWRQRVVALCARLGGLAVTASFGLACYLVLADVLAAQGLVGERGLARHHRRAGRRPRRAPRARALPRHARAAARGEPRPQAVGARGRSAGPGVAAPRAATPVEQPGHDRAAARMHLAIGLATIAAVTAAARPGLTGATGAGDVAALVLAGLALLVPVVGTRALHDGRERAGRCAADAAARALDRPGRGARGDDRGGGAAGRGAGRGHRRGGLAARHPWRGRLGRARHAARGRGGLPRAADGRCAAGRATGDLAPVDGAAGLRAPGGCGRRRAGQRPGAADRAAAGGRVVRARRDGCDGAAAVPRRGRRRTSSGWRSPSPGSRRWWSG